ncbi:hypothetical protein [Alteribacter natronophilus]|uniref:hypothetical protein n=1 Tax=Alteribacter natronophilus TaxID=2583810 RepID=UPI00110D3802|nr:hypothetical protein [Alteribacter natronophilus]TMW72253.1 hypothetical protein FGB90_08560 [Alteribacter natronophilus]
MIRNTIDYYSYIVKLQAKKSMIVAVNVLIFIFSVIALLNSFRTEGIDFAILGIFVLSLCKVGWDFYNLVDTFRSFMKLGYAEVRKEEVNLRDLKMSTKDRQLGYEYRMVSDREAVMYSKPLNKYLQEEDLTLRVEPHMEKKVKQFLVANKETLLPFLRHEYRNSLFQGKYFFNEKKLCLSSDLSTTPVAICHKGSYYDTFLTNRVCGKQLRSNQDNTLIADARPLFPMQKENDQDVIQDTTNAVMNNQIGISTLGFTSDHYLVIWTQNRKANSSNGLLAPTGSGSCDFKDRRGEDFKATITYAMERELWEESFPSNKVKMDQVRSGWNTTVLGYFKWVLRGNQPQFLGVTRLSQRYNELMPQKKEVYEGTVHAIENMPALLEEVEKLLSRQDLSVPLYMNLIFLKQYAEDNPNELERLLWGE